MVNLSEKTILFLVHKYTSFQKDQIEILSQYFHHVYVLVRYKPIAEISRFFPFNALRLHQKRYIIQLRNKPQNVSVFTVPLYYFPTERCYLKLGDQHFKKTIDIIKNNNISFDLIHSHFIWTSGYVGAKLKECYDKKFIITSHRNNEQFFKELATRGDKYYWAIKQADVIIRVNQATIPLLKKHNEYTIEIPNGFHSKFFYPQSIAKCRKKNNISKDCKVILTVGSLDKKKGHEYLIKSMQYIIKHYSNILCIIVGGGFLYSYLNSYTSYLKLQKYVKLVGYKNHEEIPEWMNACDLFVLPSLSESFGIVQLEAMACGKPVVATVNGGSESLITSDVGLLCEKENSQDLAEKILLALGKSWNEEKIREYASQYTLDAVCKKIVDVYQDVLK